MLPPCPENNIKVMQTVSRKGGNATSLSTVPWVPWLVSCQSGVSHLSLPSIDADSRTMAHTTTEAGMGPCTARKPCNGD